MAAPAAVCDDAAMKLGTSLRFLFPTSPQTHVAFRQTLAAAPATVVQELAEYRAMGFEDVMVRHVVGDHAQMLASFERIGREVMPAIREM